MKSQKNLIYQNLGVLGVFFVSLVKVSTNRRELWNSKDNPSKSSEWHQRETAIQEMIFPSDIL